MKVPTLHDTSINEETGEITIDSVNIDSFQIKYYLIDAEILFSNSPFVEEKVENFSFVVPFSEHKLLAQKDTTVNRYKLPEQLKKKNMVIEVKSNHS